MGMYNEGNHDGISREDDSQESRTNPDTNQSHNPSIIGGEINEAHNQPGEGSGILHMSLKTIIQKMRAVLASSFVMNSNNDSIRTQNRIVKKLGEYYTVDKTGETAQHVYDELVQQYDFIKEDDMIEILDIILKDCKLFNIESVEWFIIDALRSDDADQTINFNQELKEILDKNPVGYATVIREFKQFLSTLVGDINSKEYYYGALGQNTASNPRLGFIEKFKKE